MRRACTRVSFRYALSCRRPIHGPFSRSTRSFHHSRPHQSYKYGPFTIDGDAFEPRPEPNTNAKNIAVLGGGITGLATAFNLSRSIPQAKITILEASDRLGGWINSETIDIDDGEVIFEWGPRNIRPDLAGPGMATAILLQKLELEQSLVPISKWSEAALNRYIFYPDHLVRMPGAPTASGILGRLSYMFEILAKILREPIFSGSISALLAEPTVKGRSAGVADESVGDFIERRFGRSITQNMVSALFHGIYAGDIYKLSARTLLAKPWYYEKRDPETEGVMTEIFELMMKKQVLISENNIEFFRLLSGGGDLQKYSQGSLLALLANSSVYTFTNGLEELVKALDEYLRSSENITIRTNTIVKQLSVNESSKTISVTTTGSSSLTQPYDHVVSTLPPAILHSSLPPNTSPSITHALKTISTSNTVMVINLYYSDPNLIPPHHAGFGYLIPSSVPIEQNPERALGVIFGSYSSGPRGTSALPDYSRPKTGQDTAPGTKLTVMLGGHWWTDWSPTDIPSESSAIELSQTLLARHLNITTPPTLARTKLATSAIPQYPVHYRTHMSTLHSHILSNYNGRLKLAGPWYQGGVGINDCVKRAFEIATYIREGWDECTGLQEYKGDEVWYLADKRTGKMSVDTGGGRD